MPTKRKLYPPYNELLEAVEDMVNQACQRSHDRTGSYLDPMCISAYEDAIHLLVKQGSVRQYKRMQRGPDGRLYRYKLMWKNPLKMHH